MRSSILISRNQKNEGDREKYKNGDVSQMSIKQDAKPFDPKTAFNNDLVIT